MEMNGGLSKTMDRKKVMEHANNRVGTLSSVVGLVNQVVNLPGQSFAANSEDCALPRF